MTNEVTATLRDVAGAGALVDAAAQAAGDAVRVQQITFGIDDDAQPRAGARADAVRQAVTQARQLADAAEVGLGPILSITELSEGQPPVPITRDSAAAAQASVPIEPGTQDVSVTVEVVHAVAGLTGHPGLRAPVRVGSGCDDGAGQGAGSRHSGA